MISFGKFCWKKRGKEKLDPDQKPEPNRIESLFVAPNKLCIYKEIERYLLRNHIAQSHMDHGVQTDARPLFEIKQICINSKCTESIKNSEERPNTAQKIINSGMEEIKICPACIFKPRRKWEKDTYMCCKYEEGIFEEFPFVNTSTNMRDKISTEINTEGKWTDIIKSRIKTEMNDSVATKIIGTQTINQNQDFNDSPVRSSELTNLLSNNLLMKTDTLNSEKPDKVELNTDAEYSDRTERKLDTIHEEEDQTNSNSNLNGSSIRSDAQENWRGTIEFSEAEEQKNKKFGETRTPEYIALAKLEEIENFTEGSQDFKDPSVHYAITEEFNLKSETEEMSDENLAVKRNTDTVDENNDIRSINNNNLDTNITMSPVSSLHSSEQKSNTTLGHANLSTLNKSSYRNEANFQLDVIQNDVDNLATEPVNNKKFIMHRPQLVGSAAQIPLNWSKRKGKRSVYRECNCGCERISKICCPMNIHGNFICRSAVASKSRSSCCMRHVCNVPGNSLCSRGLCVDASENTDGNKSRALPWIFQANNEQSQTEYTTTFTEISLNRCSAYKADSSFSSFHWTQKRQPQCQFYRDNHFERHWRSISTLENCTRNPLNSHSGLNLYYANTQPNESYFMPDNTIDTSRLIVSRFSSVTRDVSIRPAIMNYCYSFNGH